MDKKVKVEIFKHKGMKVIKEIINVEYPAKYNVAFVDNFDEFKDYKWLSDKNTENIELEYILTQKYTENCNGFKVLWSRGFKRIAINRERKIKRSLTVGEAWNFGDNIN